METPPIKTPEEILKSPTLLDDFIRETERLGHRGESDIKKILLLSILSCRRRKPISVIVQGESSSGKSSTVDCVKEFTPDEFVLDLSAVTPAAFWNLPKLALKNRAVFIAERNGASGADYPIRTLQSEGVLARLVSVPQDEGPYKTVKQTVEGPCSFIQTTTSTQSDRNAENETRTFVLYSDDSESLTYQVIEAQKEQYLSIGLVLDRSLLCQAWKEAFRLLKPIRVIIPYVHSIKFPTNLVRARRDHSRFLSLIEMVAHLYQYQRETLPEDVIVASSEDYRIAYDLFAPLMPANVQQISPKLAQLHETLRRHAEHHSFTYASAAELMNWNRKTVRKYVDEGLEAGFFDAPKGIRSGVTSSFRWLEQSKKPGSLSISTPEEIERALALSNCPKG
jgi:hypothetical protein